MFVNVIFGLPSSDVFRLISDESYSGWIVAGLLRNLGLFFGINKKLFNS
jgi:hypothetical protein